MNNLSNDSMANLTERLAADFAGDFVNNWTSKRKTSSLYYSTACGVLFPVLAIGVLTLLTYL